MSVAVAGGRRRRPPFGTARRNVCTNNEDRRAWKRDARGGRGSYNQGENPHEQGKRLSRVRQSPPSLIIMPPSLLLLLTRKQASPPAEFHRKAT